MKQRDEQAVGKLDGNAGFGEDPDHIGKQLIAGDQRNAVGHHILIALARGHQRDVERAQNVDHAGKQQRAGRDVEGAGILDHRPTFRI